MMPAAVSRTPGAYFQHGVEGKPSPKAAASSGVIRASPGELARRTASGLVARTGSHHRWPAPAICFGARQVGPAYQAPNGVAQGIARQTALEGAGAR
jgi:hypothetical protein